MDEPSNTSPRGAPGSAEGLDLPRQSTARLPALVQAIPDLIWLKDASGTYLSCNQAFERYFGALESSIIGHTDHDFVTETEADSLRLRDQKAFASRPPTTNEEWLTFANDGYRGLFLTTRTPIRDADDKLVGLLGVARDITEHKKAESLLHASELRYRRLFESARDGILIVDADTGMVSDVNPYLIERLGFTRGEFLGKKLWELGFFRDIIANKASFAELQQNEYVRYEDKPLETANGQRIDVEFVSNVYLVNGQRVIQCNIRDITARKASDRMVREQNEILSNSHEGVMIVSLANEVSLWNGAAERMLGWSRTEALGSPPERLLGIGDLSLTSALREAVDRDGFWNGELPVQAHGGRKFTLDCRVTLVRDESGRPRARLSYFSDLTEKKLLESKFLRVQRLEAIGTLSGGIAHDLNNILSPMLMAAGLLRGKLADPEDRELMGLIEHAGLRGADIIKQLLTFSRGIEGKRVNVQVRHLIKEVAGLIRATFPRNITLVENTETDLWPIVADATHLHQVLLNLCVNARDAMPEGGTLTITAKNVQLSKHESQLGANAHDGPYTQITVRDTGQGIPHDVIDRIFEPFFTTKALGQGTGLGLSTVLGIVHSHDGFITVYSEPGQGTVFHVYLPAIPDGCETVAAADNALMEGGGETVLVVDDEATIVTAVRICLEGAGYHVLTAKDGREALEVFGAHQPPAGIVVTDVMMPVMDGLKLARALRQLNPTVRVIASSGLDLAERSGEIAAGFITEFLNKPYQPRTLLAAVCRQRRHTESDPARPPPAPISPGVATLAPTPPQDTATPL